MDFINFICLRTRLGQGLRLEFDMVHGELDPLLQSDVTVVVSVHLPEHLSPGSLSRLNSRVENIGGRGKAGPPGKKACLFDQLIEAVDSYLSLGKDK